MRLNIVFEIVEIVIIFFLVHKVLNLKKSNRSLILAEMDLIEKNEELNSLSTTDTLTGLMNRRAIEPFIENEINRMNRYNSPVSLLMLDLDHFKRVNDNYGHDFGDRVLQYVAEMIRSICRKTDNFARWGGEEFLILAADTTADNASYLAEKIRRKIESSSIESLDDLTVSIGISECHREEVFQDWFKRADIALYEAKDSGRNRIAVHTDDRYKEKSMGERQNILRLEWKNAYSSGIAQIDEMHRSLFFYSNKIIDTVLNNEENRRILETFEEMLAIVKDYFEQEIIILENIEFSDLESHKREHEQLIVGMERLISQFQEDEANSISMLNYITKRLVLGHMVNSDKKYFHFMERKTQS